MILRDVIIVLTPTDVATDDYGNISQTWASPTETLEPAQVWPVSSTEDVVNSDRTVTRWRVVLI